MHRHRREKRGTECDQRVRTQSRFFSAPLALEPEGCAEKRGDQHPRGKKEHVRFRNSQLCCHGISLALTPAGGISMLWTIIFVLLVLWLLGFALDVAGGLIHVLLVVALVIIVMRLLTGRKVV
jgi:hypothetical protein